MSEPKTLNLTSLVSKKTRRAKARLMQNFGKADKTTDELYEVYQLNFNRQQSTALNFQKHVKHYLHCLKELHNASKELNHSLLELHEKDWPRHDVLDNNAYEMDHVNEELEEKLKESVLVPLEQYLGQFAEMRDKMAKRGRKLIDYDSQRHTFETLQQSLAGRQAHDDSKLNKHRDQLDEARKVYEALNSELHDELPALHDNRLPFIITVFQRLFSSEIAYHNDLVDIHKSYLETVEQLAKASEKGSFNTIRQLNPTSTKPHEISNHNLDHSSQKNNSGHKFLQNYNGKEETAMSPSNLTKTTPTTVPNAAGSDKPPVLLHKVRATYRYMAEDEDELSFEAGETIQVIEYDDPQEQEEGWLMGIKESDGHKGLFPANFTKEI